MGAASAGELGSTEAQDKFGRRKPATDPLFNDYHDIGDIPQHFLAEVAHFFRVYKDLEMAGIEVLGWKSAAVAREVITRAVQLFEDRFG